MIFICGTCRPIMPPTCGLFVLNRTLSVICRLWGGIVTEPLIVSGGRISKNHSYPIIQSSSKLSFLIITPPHRETPPKNRFFQLFLNQQCQRRLITRAEVVIYVLRDHSRIKTAIHHQMSPPSASKSFEFAVPYHLPLTQCRARRRPLKKQLKRYLILKIKYSLFLIALCWEIRLKMTSNN
jgi:hypothetical protein